MEELALKTNKGSTGKMRLWWDACEIIVGNLAPRLLLPAGNLLVIS